MLHVTEPQQYVSAASLTSNTGTEAQDSMATMNMCRVCLAISEKMYHMSEHKLRVMYERVTGVEINTDNMLPKMLCWECVGRLSSAHKFQEKALKTHYLLMKKLDCSNIETIRNVVSIDRAQYQLESTLGFKYYKRNYSDICIVEKSDKMNDNLYNYYEEREEKYSEMNDFEPHDVEEPIIVTDFDVTDERDPIKREYVDANEEQNLGNENDIGAFITDEEDEHIFQNFDPHFYFSVKECVGDEEVIDNVNIEMCNEENEILEARELCEEIKQSQKSRQRNRRSKALPQCKELKVVLEDVMLILNKNNTQDTFKQHADTAETLKGKRTMCPPFKTIKVSNPVNADNVANARTGTVSSYLSIVEDTTKPSKKICDICGKQFQFKASLLRQIRKHPKMYSCTYCSSETADKKNLNFQVNTKHTKTNNNKIYNCSLCSYKAYQKAHLTRHVNAIHTKTNVYNCSLCSFKTYDTSSLSRHINAKHTKTNVYYCSLCSYKANQRANLTRHVNAKHSETKVYNSFLL